MPEMSVSGRRTTLKIVRILVVVEEVPDPLCRVDDVVEVQLELLRQEPLDMPLEQP